MIAVHEHDHPMGAIGDHGDALVLRHVRENGNLRFEVDDMAKRALGISQQRRDLHAGVLALEGGEDFGGMKGADGREPKVSSVDWPCAASSSWASSQNFMMPRVISNSAAPVSVSSTRRDLRISNSTPWSPPAP